MVRTDAERASAGMLVLFIVGLFLLIFIWILMGAVHDRVLGIHDITAGMSDPFYVSDERMNAMNTLEGLWTYMPFLGIILPLIVYAVVISIRKQSGDV